MVCQHQVQPHLVPNAAAPDAVAAWCINTAPNVAGPDVGKPCSYYKSLISIVMTILITVLMLLLSVPLLLNLLLLL